MKNWILTVGYNRLHFEAAQKEWLKFNVLLQSAATVAEAIHMFSTRPYIAVIASFELPDMMFLIRAMRESRKVPLLVLPQEDSGTETAESIIKGADTFVIDTENLIDSIKNSKDIIDHISGMSSHNKQLLGVLTFRELFMMVEYHKLFVGEIEGFSQKAISLFCNCSYRKRGACSHTSSFTCLPTRTKFQKPVLKTPCAVISSGSGKSFAPRIKPRNT